MADNTKLSLIMGARNGALKAREENDYYVTDPRALELFLDKFTEDGERLADKVWECACGEGHYKHAKEFVLEALDSINNGHKVIFFLKCQFLEGQDRFKNIFKDYPPKYVYIHSARQNCAKNGAFDKYTSATLCYCWFVWQKGFKGETILRWIP